ncbi:hypothetical protein J1N35_036422 [Gossypium stocksii]|uniref:DRBM domain-containing protein n=1 Tax=Gossypium stocksii TaxID=47602 RepID=A0A9D3UIE4_9ROSI|nr:hypothetical protein J1N35_036422 [Gossypium stocksii]
MRVFLDISTPLTAAGVVAEGLAQHLHKNRLQEYAQRSGVGLPVYHSFNEGFAHAPRFKATARVGRVTYTSRLTFPHRKEAEQNVARVQSH